MTTEKTDLRGQTALVTGASRGLGRHIALELARKGVKVAVAARTEADLSNVAQECGAMPIVIDVTRWGDVERGVNAVRDRLGKIDILVARHHK